MEKVLVPAKYKYLAQISRFVGKAAKEANLDKASIYAVKLAVDEACSNIMEHAYSGKGKGEILCSCEIIDNGLKVTLTDHGNPLNSKEVPEFDSHTPLEEIEPGGAGIYLINQLMDQVHYESDPQLGNRMELVKHKEENKNPSK